MEASKQGLPYSTVRKHWLGERELGLKSVIRYEQILGIPRSELMPAFYCIFGYPLMTICVNS